MKVNSLAVFLVLFRALSLADALAARSGPAVIDNDVRGIPIERDPQDPNTTTAPPATASSAPPTSAPPASTNAPTDSGLSTAPVSTTTSATSSLPATTPPTTTSAPMSTGVMTTNVSGSVVTVVFTATRPAPTTSSSPSPSSNSAGSGSGVGTKSIVGLVVAGVLAVLGIAGFVYWKLTRKRFSGYDDDGDAIKWPELNNNDSIDASAMQPLPNRNLGKGEFDDSSSQVNLAQVYPGAPPTPYYDTQSAGSTVDLSHAPVEPAHSQYYDQPQGYGPAYAGMAEPGNRESGYYDPYAGPVPQAFSPQAAAYGQGQGASPDPAGRTAPGPNLAYGARAASPGAGVAYGGRASSPGPNTAYGGRTGSPGPNAAYGGRVASPGVHAAYAGRTGSPGPGTYNPRSTSPGPNAAYGGAPYGQHAASPGGNAAYRTS